MNKNQFVKTKIICTVGPATNNISKIKSLIMAGTDAIRLNFSHGTYEDHLLNLNLIKKVEKSLGKTVTVVQDLQGPKIRVGELVSPFIILKRGQILKLTTKTIQGNSNKISVTYK